MPDPETPKIIVDSDWKSQARAEKEKLAASEKKTPGKSAPAGAAAGPEQPGASRMPPADFQSLVGTLITQALMYMGGFPDESGRAVVSLEHAKFHIDLLGVLEAKTKGNITEQEAADVSQALNELRLRYVDLTKAVAQAMQERQAGRAGGDPAGPGPSLRMP